VGYYWSGYMNADGTKQMLWMDPTPSTQDATNAAAITAAPKSDPNRVDPVTGETDTIKNMYGYDITNPYGLRPYALTTPTGHADAFYKEQAAETEAKNAADAKKLNERTDREWKLNPSNLATPTQAQSAARDLTSSITNEVKSSTRGKTWRWKAK
jgi:hypothetical protein